MTLEIADNITIGKEITVTVGGETRALTDVCAIMREVAIIEIDDREPRLYAVNIGFVTDKVIVEDRDELPDGATINYTPARHEHPASLD